MNSEDNNKDVIQIINNSKITAELERVVKNELDNYRAAEDEKAKEAEQERKKERNKKIKESIGEGARFLTIYAVVRLILSLLVQEGPLYISNLKEVFLRYQLQRLPSQIIERLPPKLMDNVCEDGRIIRGTDSFTSNDSLKEMNRYQLLDFYKNMHTSMLNEIKARVAKELGWGEPENWSEYTICCDEESDTWYIKRTDENGNVKKEKLPRKIAKQCQVVSDMEYNINNKNYKDPLRHCAELRTWIYEAQIKREEWAALHMRYDYETNSWWIEKPDGQVFIGEENNSEINSNEKVKKASAWRNGLSIRNRGASSRAIRRNMERQKQYSESSMDNDR